MAGCVAAPQPAAPPDQRLSPIDVPQLRAVELPIARLDQAAQSHFRYTSGMTEPRMIVIRGEAAWDSQWRLATARSGPPPPLPRVNFQDDMLLMAAMGPRGSGGFSVTFERVIEQGNVLLAFVRFTSPGPRCGAIAVITSPIDIVRLQRSSKDVRWQVEKVSTECD